MHPMRFDLAEDSNVTLRDGEMNDCNSDGNSWGGAIVNYPGGTTGALTLENIEISDSLVNLINVDFEDVWISNLTATSASSKTGTVRPQLVLGQDYLHVFNMDATGYNSATIDSLESLYLKMSTG